MLNRNKQRGVTALGWLVILGLIGIFSIATLRLFPIYLEYYRISSVLSALKADSGTESSTKKEIQTYIRKRFDIEAITVLGTSDVKITRNEDNWRVRAAYDARAPFIGNLGFIVNFDKSVEVPR